MWCFKFIFGVSVVTVVDVSCLPQINEWAYVCHAGRLHADMYGKTGPLVDILARAQALYMLSRECSVLIM